tara:strand:+ start:611 stop:802 length:192 start_codon:yes stop_codon:yes gene_type:complete
MDNGIPKEIQLDGDWPWVKFKNTPKLGALDGIVVSKDVGGLTLVATWVRTDSFIDESVIEDET